MIRIGLIFFPRVRFVKVTSRFEGFVGNLSE
jgi:hypothetical protein